jgi:hypothetical protein
VFWITRRSNHSLTEIWMSPMSISLCILANILKKEYCSDAVFSARICSEFHVTYVISKLVLALKKL